MADTTASEAKMLPWHAYPSPATDPACSKHSVPVKDTDRPAASTMPICLVSFRSSPRRSRSRAAAGSTPPSRRSRPRGPNVALAKAWVATAPTAPRAQGTTAPTARNFDSVATPTSPAGGSAATIEKVMPLSRPAVPCPSSPSRVPYAGVEERIHHVHDQVRHDDEQRSQHRHPHDRRKIV